MTPSDLFEWAEAVAAAKIIDARMKFHGRKCDFIMELVLARRMQHTTGGSDPVNLATYRRARDEAKRVAHHRTDQGDTMRLKLNDILAAGLPDAPPPGRGTTAAAILSALRGAGGPLTPLEILSATGLSYVALRRQLTRLVRSGDIVRIAHGQYIAKAQAGCNLRPLDVKR